MKFSTSFSSLLVVILPLLLEAAALPNGFSGGFGGRANQGFGGAGGRFGGNTQNQNQKGAGSQQGKGNNNANNNANNATTSTASTASNNASSTASTANNNNNANNNANSDSNPQTSLTLDPSVIGPGYAQTGIGANGSEAGEVASLTTTNNFINFCLGQQITNGEQFSTASCNPIPMGQIPSKGNLPSAKFTSPVNGQNFEENQTFTISMAIQGLQTGAFVNADTNFLGAPQQLASSGQVIGHSHVVIQPIQSFTDTTPADPTKFTYFKGLNDAAQGGVLSTTVNGGLAAGFYKVSTINTAANHQPVLAPIAQHGSFDDAVYFSVGSVGQDQTFGNAGAAAAGGANNAAAASASGAATGGANNATATGANGAAATATGANGTAAKGTATGNTGGAAAKGTNGAAAKGANGANNAQAGGATKAAGGAKQQQQGKGRRSFTISRQTQ